MNGNELKELRQVARQLYDALMLALSDETMIACPYCGSDRIHAEGCIVGEAINETHRLLREGTL